ncbi:hypothetical protein AKG95_13470 [Janthinobacterium lividum]|uniref:Uncharacterized protein n=1 Tax=Janthinobacterium lividum TaxID=29581 RepID=A0A1S1U600_9BURK|nr:hypothetical protein AKG95_13470 [Janthinobacterium lividum]
MRYEFPVCERAQGRLTVARDSAPPGLGRNGSFRLIQSSDVDFMLIMWRTDGLDERLGERP